MEDKELVRAAIKHSRKSVTRFATEDLVREPRTVRRWLAGDAPVPQLVRRFLEDLLKNVADA